MTDWGEDREKFFEEGRAAMYAIAGPSSGAVP